MAFEVEVYLGTRRRKGGDGAMGGRQGDRRMRDAGSSRMRKGEQLDANKAIAKKKTERESALFIPSLGRA